MSAFVNVVEVVGSGLLGLGVNYAVHSTLLVGVAAGILSIHKILTGMPCLRLEECLWRFALFGALVTVPLQVVIGLGGRVATPLLSDLTRPLQQNGNVHVDVQHERTSDERATAARSIGATTLRELTSASPAEDAHATFVLPPIESLDSLDPMHTDGRAVADRPHDLATVIGGLWLLVALILASRVLIANQRLRLHLARLPAVSHSEATSIAAELAIRADLKEPPAVLLDDRASTPFVAGRRSPCIVLPARALTELSASELRAVLAHETGHLVRRDVTWRAATRFVATISWYQPLTWLLARRLTTLSEHSCDDWAARLEGQGFTLARSLTTVAAWQRPRVPPPTPSLALTRSGLRRRISRLINHTKEIPAMSNSQLVQRGLLPCLTGALLIAMVVPVFSIQSPPETPPAAPAAVPVVSTAAPAPVVAPSPSPIASPIAEPVVLASPEPVPSPRIAPAQAPAAAPRVAPAPSARVVVGPTPTDKELADRLLEAARRLQHEDLTPEQRARLLVELRRHLGSSTRTEAHERQRRESSRDDEARAARARELRERELAAAERLARSAEARELREARQLLEQARRRAASQHARDERRARAAYEEALSSSRAAASTGDRDAQIRDLEAQLIELEQRLERLRRQGDV